jgi:hypothetical protein
MPSDPFSSPQPRTARHGLARLLYPHAVEESRILQVSTFGTLHNHQSKMNQNQVPLDVITIADEADRQLTQSVLCFIAAQATA